MFIWMFNESKRFNVDKHGGLILDRMAIQEDLKQILPCGIQLLNFQSMRSR